MAPPVTLPPPLALLGGAPTGPGGGFAEPGGRHPMSDVIAPRAGGPPPMVTAMGAVRAEYKPLYFDVELQKPPNSRLGIDVMLVTGGSLCGLFVERVAEGGCMDQWNRQSRHPRVVMPGDFIVQVNGIGTQNLQRMAEEFARDSRQVCFSIQRNTQPRVPEPALVPTAAAVAAAAAAGPPPTRLLFDTKARPPPPQPFSAAPGLQALPPNAHAPGLRAPGTLAKAVAGLPAPGMDGGEGGALPAEDAAFVIDGQRIDRGRASCTPVAPIGAGRSSAPAPAPVEAERAAPEAARAAVRLGESSKEAAGKKDTQPPAKLLQSTLQLGDKELSHLLRAALKERPRLITPISEALGALIG